MTMFLCVESCSRSLKFRLLSNGHQSKFNFTAFILLNSTEKLSYLRNSVRNVRDSYVLAAAFTGCGRSKLMT